MKYIRPFICLALLLCILVSTSLFAAADEYTYTVRLYAGNIGTVDGQNIVVYDGLHEGDRVTFYIDDVTVPESGKYYVKGFRESGRDNDTVEASSFVVTRDIDYVVAYGVPGDQVAYTVRYLDQNGAQLASEATFYGNVGDKPVVAFIYIDGYHPQAYNLTKTLSENAAENVFTFTYYKSVDPAESGDGQTANPAPGTADASSPHADDPASDTASVQDTPTDVSASDLPFEVVDLDATDTAAKAGERADTVKIWLPILIAVLALSAGLIVFLLILSARKKRKTQDER